MKCICPITSQQFIYIYIYIYIMPYLLKLLLFFAVFFFIVKIKMIEFSHKFHRDCDGLKHTLSTNVKILRED
jgi:hypothetical protein